MTQGAFAVQQRLAGPQKKNPIVFDCGCNVGNTVEVYLRMWPQARLFAFDARKEAVAATRKKFKGRPNVKVFHAALADKLGQRDFHVSSHVGASSLYPKDPSFPHGWKMVRKIKVGAMTLDVFCNEQKLPRIDVLKMDLQGGELTVLKGATGLLERAAIDVVYSEILYLPMYDGGCLHWEVFQILAQYGYHMHSQYPAATRKNGQVVFGDAIWVSPTARKRLKL